MKTETNDAPATGAHSIPSTSHADFEFEIQTRLGRIARQVEALSGGDRLARALTDLQGALADCDIAPIDQPTLAPDQLDASVQDVHGMIAAARRVALTGDQDAVAHLLELAGARLEKDVIPATMAAAAGSGSPATDPRPALAAVDASADGLYEAQQAAEGASLGLSRLDGMLAAMATSDSDESQLRDCVFCAREMLRPIRDNARSALDLVTNHLRDPSDPAKID